MAIKASFLCIDSMLLPSCCDHFISWVSWGVLWHHWGSSIWPATRHSCVDVLIAMDTKHETTWNYHNNDRYHYDQLWNHGYTSLQHETNWYWQQWSKLIQHHFGRLRNCQRTMFVQIRSNIKKTDQGHQWHGCLLTIVDYWKHINK